jgi:hypothetical protein
MIAHRIVKESFRSDDRLAGRPRQGEVKVGAEHRQIVLERISSSVKTSMIGIVAIKPNKPHRQ